MIIYLTQIFDRILDNLKWFKKYNILLYILYIIKNKL